MPEEVPTPLPQPIEPTPSSTAAAQEAQPSTKFEIGEEFGTAKKNLPPAKIVIIGVAIILVVGGILAIVQRPRSHATGSIDDVVSTEIAGQNSVMVALNLSIHNEDKESFKLHSIKVDLDTNSGSFTDEPASAVDLDRYFQALPALKQHALAPLTLESVIPPGGSAQGTIVVSFPISPDVFAARKTIKVTIWPYYAQVPLVLQK